MKEVANKREFSVRITIVVTVAWLSRVCCCSLGNRRGAGSNACIDCLPPVWEWRHCDISEVKPRQEGRLRSVDCFGV